MPCSALSLVAPALILRNRPMAKVAVLPVPLFAWPMMSLAPSERHDCSMPIVTLFEIPGHDYSEDVDPESGVEHDFCGRTHAKQALGDGLQEPHGCCHTCKQVHFETDTGRVHDFCYGTHAMLAINRGEWSLPLKRLQGQGGAPCARSEQCSLNGCAAPPFRDPGTGVVHDNCGRRSCRTRLQDRVGQDRVGQAT